MLDSLGDLRRTHTCGELRASDAGSRAVLMGWVNRRRDLGNLIFIDVRDRTGITQVVFDRERSPRLHDKAEALRSEYVIAVIGAVEQRDPDTVNRNIATGEVEVVAEELLLLNESKTPPFLPSEPTLPNEEVRLTYRYIDLRRAAMQANIELRHKIALAIREYLASRGFFEIETPFLTRSTPEGARDFLVPSRVQPGKFYALPQSPQLFKQILMISGFDKYFQIVRCFRDEDLRADRQLEFTQVDLEMSFPQQERVFEVTEGFLKAGFSAAGVDIPTPFRKMTYDQAIRSYGSDKPDLRLPPMADVREALPAETIAQLKIAPDAPVMAIRIPQVGELSRKERDEIKPLFGTRGDARLFEDFKRLEKLWPEAMQKVRQLAQAAPDDLIVLVAGPERPAEHKSEGGVKPEVKQHDVPVYTAAGALRVALGQRYADRHKAFAGARNDPASYHFLWVTDFPMFEWDEEGQRWAAAHHPFTSPHEQDMGKLESDPASVRALAYDVVLNGTELGSGSIRIHQQEIQQKIFKSLGMTPEEAQARFGFFLEALTYGTPPHGGIALGLDRIVMILAGADSLREVIPFPKTAKAVDLMVDAPTPVPSSQLGDLAIRFKRMIHRELWTARNRDQLQLRRDEGGGTFLDAQDQRVTISFDYGRADKEWTFRWDKHCDYIILLCLRGDESITAFRLERNVIDLIQNQKGPWIVRVMDENGSFSLIHGDVRLPVTPMG
ncbi:MAG: aspartate--tRNA ligase [Acidobacteriia bacterium]|nr:aspartate--tRNA ligase [Terriglobia bacterium]